MICLLFVLPCLLQCPKNNRNPTAFADHLIVTALGLSFSHSVLSFSMKIDFY